MHVGGISYDIAEAFNCVLSKLSVYGISGLARQWFQFYLHDRK